MALGRRLRGRGRRPPGRRLGAIVRLRDRLATLHRVFGDSGDGNGRPDASDAALLGGPRPAVGRPGLPAPAAARTSPGSTPRPSCARRSTTGTPPGWTSRPRSGSRRPPAPGSPCTRSTRGQKILCGRRRDDRANLADPECDAAAGAALGCRGRLSVGCLGRGFGERCEQEVEFGDVAGVEVGVVGAGGFGVAREQGLQDMDQCGDPGWGVRLEEGGEVAGGLVGGVLGDGLGDVVEQRRWRLLGCRRPRGGRPGRWRWPGVGRCGRRRGGRWRVRAVPGVPRPSRVRRRAHRACRTRWLAGARCGPGRGGPAAAACQRGCSGAVLRWRGRQSARRCPPPAGRTRPLPPAAPARRRAVPSWSSVDACPAWSFSCTWRARACW